MSFWKITEFNSRTKQLHIKKDHEYQRALYLIAIRIWISQGRPKTQDEDLFRSSGVLTKIQSVSRSLLYERQSLAYLLFAFFPGSVLHRGCSLAGDMKRWGTIKLLCYWITLLHGLIADKQPKSSEGKEPCSNKAPPCCPDFWDWTNFSNTHTLPEDVKRFIGPEQSLKASFGVWNVKPARKHGEVDKQQLSVNS